MEREEKVIADRPTMEDKKSENQSNWSWNRYLGSQKDAASKYSPVFGKKLSMLDF